MKRWLSSLPVALMLVVLVPATALASPPVITRTHQEITLGNIGCGIDLLNVSIDQTIVTRSEFDPTGNIRYHLTMSEHGTATDPVTGIVYRWNDNSTQTFFAIAGKPSVNVAEGTFTVVGPGGTGFVAKGLNQITILPDGTVVSERTTTWFAAADPPYQLQGRARPRE